MTRLRPSGILRVEELETRANPTTFTVNSAADTVLDDGQLTLREAMLSILRRDDLFNPAVHDAATNTSRISWVPVADGKQDTIEFSIPSENNAPVTITLGSKLPPFLNGITINGYTQPGATRNTAAYGSNAAIRVVLDGSQLPDGAATGFHLLPNNVNSANQPRPVRTGLITGLSLVGFGDAAINLSTSGRALRIDDIEHRESVQIAGNFIGLRPDGGTAASPKNGVGILSTASSQLVIGGTRPGDRNVISNSVTDGVLIENQLNPLVNDLDEPVPARYLDLSNNLIGTTASGTAAFPNGGSGVRVIGSAFLRIGGWQVAPGANTKQSATWSPFPGGGDVSPAPFGGLGIGNVISGNALNGIIVSTSGPGRTIVRSRSLPEREGFGITIHGNLVGIGADGTTALGNGVAGVFLDRSGEVDVQLNTISDNGTSGVLIARPAEPAGTGVHPDHNYVYDNLIGTDSKGVGGHGNGHSGVTLRGPTGQSEVYRNTIASNGDYGIVLQRAAGQPGATLLPERISLSDNTIGLEVDGVTRAPNGKGGIEINGARDIRTANNKMVANGGPGIRLWGDDTVNITIVGNTILENDAEGVLVGPGVRQVALGAPGAGNLVIGNGADGIRAEIAVQAGNAVGLTVAHNKIGGNIGNGLVLVSDEVLGTPTPDVGAVVSDNDVYGSGAAGILVAAGGSHQFANNTIHNNLGSGMRLDDGTRYNSITGGSVTGNGLAGLATTSFPGVGNKSQDTTYYNNGGLGIDRGDDGVTLDGVPSLAAVSSGGGWFVKAKIHREPEKEYRIRLFTNTQLDPSSYGEGEALYAQGSVTTDGDGYASYTFWVPADPGGGLPLVTATSTGTDAAGWTSEFSRPPVIVHPPQANDDIRDDHVGPEREGPNGEFVIAVLYNDTDLDGGTLTITALSGVPSGWTAWTNGTFIYYLPPSNWDGSEVSFSYTVADEDGFTDTATVWLSNAI